jgi:hypothetical protein
MKIHLKYLRGIMLVMRSEENDSRRLIFVMEIFRVRVLGSFAVFSLLLCNLNHNYGPESYTIRKSSSRREAIQKGPSLPFA